MRTARLSEVLITNLEEMVLSQRFLFKPSETENKIKKENLYDHIKKFFCPSRKYLVSREEVIKTSRKIKRLVKEKTISKAPSPKSKKVLRLKSQMTALQLKSLDNPKIQKNSLEQLQMPKRFLILKNKETAIG